MIRLPAGLPRLLPAGRGMAGGRWALLSLLLALVTGAGRSLVAARLIGAREVGAMSIALLVLATVDALTASAAETALVSHPGDAEADLDAAFTLRVAQGVLVAAVLWAGAPLVGRFFDAPETPALVRGIALVPLLRGFSNPAAILLVRRIEFRRLFWWGLPDAVVGTVLVVAIGLLRRDAWALVGALIGSQAVSTAVSYAVAPRVPRLAPRAPGLARLLHYGRWIQGTRVLMFVGLHLDNLLVGKLLGAAALGVYQIAFRIGEIPAVTVGRAAAQVTLPVLTRLRGRPDRLRREYLRTFWLVMAASAAFALGLAAVVRPAVARLLGPEWLPAVPVVRILAVAMVLRVAMMLSTQLFYAVGRPRFVFAVNAARVAVMALTIYPLLRLYGASGVALSVLLSCLAGALLCLAGTRASLGAKLREPAAR
ncbi:MAG: oligosaccharide flippase family protein, partial [Gemmatimonadota bacterium]